MKKYCVTLLHCSGELESCFETDSPKTALKKWIAYSSKRPTMANISCGSIEDCMNLYKAFIYSRDEMIKYWREKKLPLNYEYVYSVCNGYLHGSRVYFLGSNNFYDSVDPFSYG